MPAYRHACFVHLSLLQPLPESSFQSTVLVALAGNDFFDKAYLSRMRMAQLEDHRVEQMSRHCN